MKSALFSLCLVSILSLSAMAQGPGRAPAIDPVVGIDITQYDDVEPEKAQGFNWNQKVQSNTTQKETPIGGEKIQDFLFRPETPQTNSFNFGQAFLLLIGLALPFALYYGIAKTFKDPEPAPGLTLMNGGNEPTPPTQSDDDEYPKAS